MAATAEFNAKLTTEPDHVWRYPPLIALSIKKLGLQNIPGFPEYAVDIGMVMSRSWSDSLLSAAGLAIFAVGILLTGPLAVGGLALDTALAGVALTDLAVTGTSGYLTYLRESEQDIAAVGGGFRPDRIAKRSNFSGSILAGSAALLPRDSVRVFPERSLLRHGESGPLVHLLRQTPEPKPQDNAHPNRKASAQRIRHCAGVPTKGPGFRIVSKVLMLVRKSRFRPGTNRMR